MANQESIIQTEIMLALSRAGILTWRQMVGKFTPLYSPKTVLNIGVAGMADIGAIVPVVVTQEMVGKTIGMAVQIEVKTAIGKQRDNQKLWELAVTSKGGHYGITRSVDDAVNFIFDVQHSVMYK